MGAKRFKAHYGRIGIIEAKISKCTVCEQEKVVISVDPSEGEYGSGCICKECTLEMFEEFEGEQSDGN